MLLRLKTNTSTKFYDHKGEELSQFLRDNSSEKGELQEDLEAFIPGLLSFKPKKEGDDVTTKDGFSKYDWVFSTDDVDRHGEIVVQSGIMLDNYRKNPVLLWAHDHFRPAIGKTEDILAGEKTLSGVVVFCPKTLDHFSWSVGQKVENKIINAGSIGIGVYDWKYVAEDDEGGDADFMLTKTELREFSMCNVPANPFAVRKEDSPEVKADDSKTEEIIKKEVDNYIQKLISNKKTDIPFLKTLLTKESK